MTLKEWQATTEDLRQQALYGCSNHSCDIVDHKIGTNGPCDCRPREIARRLRRLADDMEKRTSWREA